MGTSDGHQRAFLLTAYGQKLLAIDTDVMDRWMAWFGELGDAVVDMGAPFAASATIASDGTPSPGSGPDPANGYTIIEAANLHDAVVMAKGCPGLSGGGSVKLYEAVQMG